MREATRLAYAPTVRKAPCAKLMIFMTPKISNNPAETMYRIAAVVTMSSNRSIGDLRQVRRSCSRRLFEVRALRAGSDILEAVDHLHTAIGLNLRKVHRERRVVLLVHRDAAARAIDCHFTQRLQDLV